MARRIDQRKRRNIKRIILAVLGLALIGFWAWSSWLRPEPIPEVRTAELQIGSLASKMFVTAEIHPGAIVEQTVSQRQEVLEVHVRPGDQVQAGDLLLTLDQQALIDQYEQAVSFRQELEAAMVESDEQAQARLAEEVAAQRRLQQQTSQLTGSLSAAVGQLAGLAGTSPSLLVIDDTLAESLALILDEFDPDLPDQTIQELILVLSQAVSLAENPEYLAALSRLEREIEHAGAAAGEVVTGLASGIQGGLPLSADLISQLGQLTALGLSPVEQLAQALAAEEAARERVELSSPYLSAWISGIVAEVHVQVGDIVGAAEQAALPGGLEGLLGGSLPALPTGSSAAVTLYDNLSPKAVFQAGRFDAGRLTEGMPVIYQYEQQTYWGEITRKGRIASNPSFGQPGSTDLFAGFSGIGGFDAEPVLEMEMSITGPDLTSLILGFWLEAEIETARAEEVLLLPAEAMRREINQYYVLVVDSDNILRRVDFEPGIQSDMFVEVRSGLNPGDQVVLNPTAQHQDGLQVQVSNHE